MLSTDCSKPSYKNIYIYIWITLNIETDNWDKCEDNGDWLSLIFACPLSKKWLDCLQTTNNSRKMGVHCKKSCTKNIILKIFYLSSCGWGDKSTFFNSSDRFENMDQCYKQRYLLWYGCKYLSADINTVLCLRLNFTNANAGRKDQKARSFHYNIHFVVFKQNGSSFWSFRCVAALVKLKLIQPPLYEFVLYYLLLGFR